MKKKQLSTLSKLYKFWYHGLPPVELPIGFRTAWRIYYKKQIYTVHKIICGVDTSTKDSANFLHRISGKCTDIQFTTNKQGIVTALIL